MHSIRAKIRHKGKDIHLGYYQTQAQATAAKAGAHAALDRWEILNPPMPIPKKKMPSVKTLIHFIHQGTYDPVIEEIAEASLGRYHLIKRHNYMRGKFPSTAASKAMDAFMIPFDARKQNRTKATPSAARR